MQNGYTVAVINGVLDVRGYSGSAAYLRTGWVAHITACKVVTWLNRPVPLQVRRWHANYRAQELGWIVWRTST